MQMQPLDLIVILPNLELKINFPKSSIHLKLVSVNQIERSICMFYKICSASLLKYYT